MRTEKRYEFSNHKYRTKTKPSGERRPSLKTPTIDETHIVEHYTLREFSGKLHEQRRIITTCVLIIIDNVQETVIL